MPQQRIHLQRDFRPDPKASDTEGKDTMAAASARVSLKLAAVAYAESRAGFDASDHLVAATIFALRSRALLYYNTLASSHGRPVNRDRELPPNSPANIFMTSLCARALAYASTRHGVDAHPEYNKAAIAELCQGAIDFGQAVADLEQTSSASSSPRSRTALPLQLRAK